MFKIRSFILLFIAAITLSACASLQPKTVRLTAEFDQEQAAKMLRSGNNTISGSALIRQNGGGIVTCAGSKVWLVPATNYATERVQAIYHSASGGYLPRGTATGIQFQPDPISYKTTTETTLCGAQGQFHFDNVADGTFYVVTHVVWQVNYATQGGSLMRRVSVENGDHQKIVLAP